MNDMERLQRRVDNLEDVLAEDTNGTSALSRFLSTHEEVVAGRRPADEAMRLIELLERERARLRPVVDAAFDFVCVVEAMLLKVSSVPAYQALKDAVDTWEEGNPDLNAEEPKP